MKRIIALLPCIMLLLQANQSWAQFDKYFHNKTLRMDYAHCGDSQHDEIYFEELLEEPYWGGSKTNLIDTMFYLGIIISTCTTWPPTNSSIPGDIALFSGNGKPPMKRKQLNVAVQRL